MQTFIIRMQTFIILRTNVDNYRVRWVYDEHYRTRGSYACDTEEETREAEDYELERLESGEWVALGAIVERRCPTCSQWEDVDSLWGIVIGTEARELQEFANHSLSIPDGVRVLSEEWE